MKHKQVIDAETLDALFDSGEVDMEPYMIPGGGYRPYLEDPPAVLDVELEWALQPELQPYRGAGARWVKPGPIRDFAKDVASDRRAPEIQRQLATTLLNRVGVRAVDLELAQMVLCQPRYAAKTRRLAMLVVEHARTTFNPDF